MVSIKQIFQSFDFKNNKIFNAKVDTPTDSKHIANKEFVDNVTILNSTKANNYHTPFVFTWVGNIFGMNYKDLLDNLFFPRINPVYNNPTLDYKNFWIENVKTLNFPGDINKFQLYYNQSFPINFQYIITPNDRVSGIVPYIKIIDINNNISTYNGTSISETEGYIAFNLQYKPDLRIFFCRNYLPAIIKTDTYGDASIPEEFQTNYIFEEDITAFFGQKTISFYSPLVSTLRETEGLHTFNLSDFSFSNKLNFNATITGIFDLFIPENNFEISAHKYEVYADIYKNDNGIKQFINEIHLDITWLDYYNFGKQTINGVVYNKYQFNFGAYPNDVEIELKFKQV